MRKSIAVLLLAVNAAFSLDAAEISFSTPIPFSDRLGGVLGPAPLPNTGPFSLPRFNPALGNLQNIHIDYNLNYQLGIAVTNTVQDPLVINGNSTNTTTFKITSPSPGGPQLVSTQYINVPVVPQTSPDPANLYVGALTGGVVSQDLVSDDFASYVGLGNANFVLSYGAVTVSYSLADPALPSTYAVFGDATSSGTATIDYTYATPEPATLTLLGSALVMLGGMRLLRRLKR